MELMVSSCLFRKLCSWARSSPRASGGGPSSWRSHCRTTIRSQESPWGQVQPHPGLNPNPTVPSLPPLISELIFFFFPKQGTPAHLSVPQESYLMSTRHQSPPHPKCIVLIPPFWKPFCTVFIVCLFWQKHFMYFYVYDSKSAFAPVMH